MREQHRASGVHERLCRVHQRLANRLHRAEIRRHRPREVAADQGQVVLEREVDHPISAARSLFQPIQIIDCAASHLGPS